LKRLTTALARESCDALLTFNPSNIRYLCGWPTDGVALVTKDVVVLCVNPLYHTEAKRYASLNVTVVRLGDDPFKEIAALAKKNAVRSCALDATGELTYKRFNAVKEKFAAHNIAVKSLCGTLERLRARKTKDELACMRDAVAVSKACYEVLAPLFTVGTSERAVRIAAESYLKTAADLALAFDPIVAAGKNAATPHYTAQDGIFSRNTAVLFDQGCKVNGYCSDLTRMFVVGKMPALYHAIADVVTRAIDAAIKKVKPGVRCADVDAAARGVIEKAGYGKYFIHGTGHGVGLDVHEYPSVSAKSDAILEEGMVITIEPGIYLPGRFAFREEHMVLVTSCGHDVIDLIE